MGLWDLQSFALCIYLHFTQHSRFFGIEVMQYFAMLPLDFRSAKGDFCKMHIFHKAFWMRYLSDFHLLLAFAAVFSATHQVRLMEKPLL